MANEEGKSLAKYASARKPSQSSRETCERIYACGGVVYLLLLFLSYWPYWPLLLGTTNIESYIIIYHTTAPPYRTFDEKVSHYYRTMPYFFRHLPSSYTIINLRIKDLYPSFPIYTFFFYKNNDKYTMLEFLLFKGRSCPRPPYQPTTFNMYIRLPLRHSLTTAVLRVYTARTSVFSKGLG